MKKIKVNVYGDNDCTHIIRAVDISTLHPVHSVLRWLSVPYIVPPFQPWLHVHVGTYVAIPQDE